MGAAAGGLHSLFRDKEGGVWACGDASKGATGLSSELKGKFSTIKRLAKFDGRVATKVFAGTHTSFAVTALAKKQ